MTPGDSATPRPARRGSQVRPHLANLRVTVLGLNGIGRQVAVQLAALGVARLQLVDAGAVSARMHAAEGYAEDDIGRPKVHAPAQACHQINPKLDIQTQRRRSLRDLDLGDAVFCCPGSFKDWQSLGRLIGDPVAFVARCWLAGGAIRIDVACDRESWAASPRERLQPGRSSRSKRPPALSIPAATVAAGLVVAEFVRFAAGQRLNRTILFDHRRLALAVSRQI